MRRHLSGLVQATNFSLQINLQLLDGLVDLLAECHLIEILQNGLVDPLADTLGLGRLDLSLGVVDVVDGQEQML